MVIEAADAPKELCERTTELNVVDLQLVQHWISSAYTGFGEGPEDEKFWQSEVLNMGFSHPFLLRIILAISALHLARLSHDRRPDLLVTAATHQDKALPAYRYIVDNLTTSMNEQNCQAIAAFSTLTTVYALANPRPVGCPTSESTFLLRRLSESMYLLRGARGLLVTMCPKLDCAMKGSQTGPVPLNIDCSINPDDAHLYALESFMTNGHESPLPQSKQNAQIYRTALQLLRQSFAMIYLPDQSVGIKRAINVWVERLPKEFLEFLSSGDPNALVLLAHWCVLIKKAERFWYLSGAAERIVTAVHQNLPDDFKNLVAWPTGEMLHSM